MWTYILEPEFCGWVWSIIRDRAIPSLVEWGVKRGLDWLFGYYPRAAEAAICIEDEARAGNNDAKMCIKLTRDVESRLEQLSAEDVNYIVAKAEDGNIYAQYLLGRMYLTGQGKPQNTEKAIHWFKQSASHGNSRAQCNLGMIYFHAENYSQAREWFKQSAGHGNSLAQYYLGRIYLKGLGVTANPYEALQWFEASAYKERPRSQTNLGIMYFRGEGVPQDYYQARGWFEKAAEQKNFLAQYYLVRIYQEGLGTDVDSSQAERWCRSIQEAAESGDANAMYYAGLMYEKGLVVAHNHVEAVSYWQQAERKGNREAHRRLEQHDLI